VTKRKTRAEKRATPKCHPHCKRLPDGTVRHVLTHEDSQKGFEAMKLALFESKPDLFCTYHGGHFAACMLKHKNPLFFAARSLQQRVNRMEAFGPKDKPKLAELKRGLARLVKQARSTTQRVTTRNRRRDSHAIQVSTKRAK
jgi:hypothetical protein